MKWFLKPAFFGNLKRNEIMSIFFSYQNIFATDIKQIPLVSWNRIEFYELKFDFKMVLTPL